MAIEYDDLSVGVYLSIKRALNIAEFLRAYGNEDDAVTADLIEGAVRDAIENRKRQDAQGRYDGRL